MSSPDFTQMTPEEFNAWHAANGPTTFPEPMEEKAGIHPVRPEDVAHSYAEARQLPGTDHTPALPSRSPQVRPAAEVWGKDHSYDFTTPSGASCRLQKLAPEKLIENGLLDQLTRLPGFAQEQVDRSSGLPPVKPASEAEQMKSVLAVLQDLLPLVVVEPKIYKDPENAGDRENGKIYVSSIGLDDRMAIMQEVTSGVMRFDNFREES